MLQQVAHRDSLVRKVGEMLADIVFVAEFSRFAEHHDGHPREGLRDGGQTKDGLQPERRLTIARGDAISPVEADLAAMSDEPDAVELTPFVAGGEEAYSGTSKVGSPSRSPREARNLSAAMSVRSRHGERLKNPCFWLGAM